MYQICFQLPLLIPGEGHKAAKQHVRQQKLAGITKVVGVSKLRTKYEAPEAKRQLCSAYDIFLADERVIPSLPKLLGKLSQILLYLIQYCLAGILLNAPRGSRAIYIHENTHTSLLVLIKINFLRRSCMVVLCKELDKSLASFWTTYLSHHLPAIDLCRQHIDNLCLTDKSCPTGKTFFRKKKQPVPINLQSSEWGRTVKAATEATYMFAPKGNSISIR